MHTRGDWQLGFDVIHECGGEQAVNKEAISDSKCSQVSQHGPHQLHAFKLVARLL